MDKIKKVIVCDSGLGGISVAANLFLKNDKKDHSKTKYEIIYFNAFPDVNLGYNDLPSERAKEEMFVNALEGMKAFNPDFCIIACNTLSIIYNNLIKWYKPAFPVIGIVETAVNVMSDYLLKDNRNNIVILGTLTTVNSNVYKNHLIQKNISSDRIFQLPCPGLAKNIERVPQSCIIRESIASYCNEIAKFNIEGDIALAFCCTHYGYVKDIWEEEFYKATNQRCTIINPNDCFDFSGIPVDFSFYSRFSIEEESKLVFSNIYKSKVPKIADGLLKANVNGNLFNIER